MSWFGWMVTLVICGVICGTVIEVVKEVLRHKRLQREYREWEEDREEGL